MPTPTMNKIRIGDADVFVDARAAAEIDRLKRENDGQKGVIAALTAVRDGKFAAPAQPDSIRADADAARIAFRQLMEADERRRRDPSTAYGQHLERMANAYRAAN